MFKKKVRVSNSQNPDQFFEEEFWVDTGDLYSFVPDDYLERIGKEAETDFSSYRRILSFGLD